MVARKPRRTGPRLLAGLAAFILLCGIVIMLASSPSAPTSQTSVQTVEERVQRALREARSAERALIDANYGQVNQHLRRLDRTLSEILEQLGAD
jgi:hypothetical protein